VGRSSVVRISGICLVWTLSAGCLRPQPAASDLPQALIEATRAYLERELALQPELELRTGTLHLLHSVTRALEDARDRSSAPTARFRLMLMVDRAQQMQPPGAAATQLSQVPMLVVDRAQQMQPVPDEPAVRSTRAVRDRLDSLDLWLQYQQQLTRLADNPEVLRQVEGPLRVLLEFFQRRI